jgi:hypothetical protein
MTRASGQPANDRSGVADAIRSITGPLLSDPAIEQGFLQLLAAAGRLPGGAVGPVSDADVRRARARSAALLEELLELSLLQGAGEDDDHLADIRRFFLDPWDSYSLHDLAALWRITVDDAADICHDEIAQWEQQPESGPFRLAWAKAVGTTIRFALLRPYDVERALDDRFVEARSERWKTIPVVIRLPRFLADAFELHPCALSRLALAHRVEQILLELFATETLTGEDASGSPAP